MKLYHILIRERFTKQENIFSFKVPISLSILETFHRIAPYLCVRTMAFVQNISPQKHIAHT